MESYSQIIKKNIEYDCLLERHPYDQEMVEGIFDLILETVLSKNKEITIAGSVYLDIKCYLLMSLFNAGSTISGYYKAEVKHDMPQYAG